MTTSRFPNGITTVTKTNPLGHYGLPDPMEWITWFDDFTDYDANQWIITTTEAGTSSATEAIANAQGGILVVTNDVNDNDADFLQLASTSGSAVIEPFKFVSGKKTFFKARFKVSDATQSDFVIGLQITDTTPLDVTDGVFFQKDDGDANLDFHVEKNNTATSASAIATVADDTYLTVAFYYDGKSKVEYFVNDANLGSSVTTNLPDDEELTVSFGIQNGAAASKIMSVDYIFVSQER
jgi:hypothetical protein